MDYLVGDVLIEQRSKKRDLKGNENIEDVKTIFQNFGWKIINDETNAGADFYIGEDSVIGYVVYFNHNDISILREKKNPVKKYSI